MNSQKDKHKTINPFHLTLLQILFFTVIGLPFAYIFDTEGYYFWLVRNVSKGIILESYCCVLYAFTVIIGLYYLLGLNRKVLKYQSLDLVYKPYKSYKRLWFISFTLACCCFFIVFAQSGFSHPGISAIGLSKSDYAVQRITSGFLFNRNILNLGLGLFSSFALVIALFILKKPLILFITMVLTAALALFSLQKSPLADTVLLITFVYLFLKPLPWKKLLLIGIMCLIPISALWFISGGVSTVSMLSDSLKDRILYGQIGDLPYYFDLFSHHSISTQSMLPPYIQSLYGEPMQSASRLVMEYTNAEAVAKGTAGVATSVFVGEAFAVGGILGVLLSPYIVLLNYLLIIGILTRLPKNIFNVFIFGYLFNKITQAMLNSFGYFIFSSIQIIIIIILYLTLIYLFTLSIKRKENYIKNLVNK